MAHKKIYSPKLLDLRDSFRRAFVIGMAGSYRLNEVNGDLFSAPKTHSLAHCVGADLAMGAGIAVKFKDVYGKVDELRSQNVGSGDVAVLKDDERFIYYLVTKPKSYGKPTYDSLQSSLENMREHMVSNAMIKRATSCIINISIYSPVKEQH